MTTNPGPEYFIAQKKYEEANTPESKIAALQEMLKFVPRHKASENMVAELTWKISKMKKDIEKQKEQSKKSTGYSINVRKEGAGQIVLMGMPNTGKSTLLKLLTGTNVEIAPYPFTTKTPEIGMMDFKHIKVQLVEVPALIEGSSEGKADGTRMLSLARNADAVVVLHRDEQEKQVVIKELEKSGIIIDRKKPKITIEHSALKGITISGKQFLKIAEKQVEEALHGIGIHNANLLVEEPLTLEKLNEALDETLEYKNCLFLNIFTEKDTEKIKQEIFALLEKIIIYTKKPGQEPDYNMPLALPKNATIDAVANLIHKDIAKNLKYVRVWGSTKFPGQRVSKDYKLQSGDIIEVYS